jgi:hypothetical protein
MPGYPRHTEHLTVGYAAGCRIPAGSDWLTVWGSAFEDRVVFPTAEAAKVRAEAIIDTVSAPAQEQYPTVVAKVHRVGGTYFKIVEES